MGNLSGKQILLLILGIIIALYLINRYVCGSQSRMESMSTTGYRPSRDKNTTGYKPYNEYMTVTDDPTPFRLYNFYSPMCGWCKKFWPEWESLQKQMAKSHNLSLIGVNALDPKNENLTFYYNISSYPTIILVTPDKNIEYVGDRTPQDIHDFVMKYMNDYYAKN